MRVISGKLKGRVINGYNIDGTRPTMDRVKESVFSMIQDYLNNSSVLDLFAGSGNLGIEAISNGAKIVYFNDCNKKCIEVIKKNLENFNVLNQSILINMDYQDALNYLKNKGLKFDIIFLDPPYKKNVVNKILEIIIKKDLLSNNGLVICELDKNELFISDKLQLIKEKRYGDKEIIIYKYGN